MILIGFLFGFHWFQNHFCQRTPNGPCSKEDIYQAVSRLDGGNVPCMLEQTKGEETMRHEKDCVGFTHDPEDTTHNRIFTHLLSPLCENEKDTTAVSFYSNFRAFFIACVSNSRVG